MFKKLSYHINGFSSNSLHKVILHHNGEPTKITDMQALLSALLDRNKKHFGQASETPFAQPSLSEVLPPFDYSDTVAAILCSDLSPFTDLPPETRAFLSNMQSTTANLFSADISLEDFKVGMQKAKEGKSSSLSGRHYGIHKALLPNDLFTGLVVLLINLGVVNSVVLCHW